TGASGSLRQAASVAGIQFIGEAADLRPWYAQADAVVAPVRAGGGTRIKILEAFSYRRPVVATSVSLEGSEAEPGRHVLVGDAAEEFADRCAGLIGDPEGRERLAGEAFAKLLELYTIQSLGRAHHEMDFAAGQQSQ